MKRALAVACCSLIIAFQARAESAQEIMLRNYESTRVSASSFLATIELKSPSGQIRKRQTQNLSLLDHKSNARITRFLAPADVKGTATLLIEHQAEDDDMWIYLPALKKTRRLVASNKRDSYVGTDLTFGDILGHKVSDWTHESAGKGSINAEMCAYILSTPVSERVKSETGYSKRMSCVSPISGIALRTEYWDEFGKPLKWVQASKVVEVELGRHWQPMLLEAVNLQSGHSTLIKLEGFRVDPELGKEVFKVHRLEREF